MDAQTAFELLRDDQRLRRQLAQIARRLRRVDEQGQQRHSLLLVAEQADGRASLSRSNLIVVGSPVVG